MPTSFQALRRVKAVLLGGDAHANNGASFHIPLCAFQRRMSRLCPLKENAGCHVLCIYFSV